jgi:hypothetical protein
MHYTTTIHCLDDIRTRFGVDSGCLFSVLHPDECLEACLEFCLIARGSCFGDCFATHFRWSSSNMALTCGID